MRVINRRRFGFSSTPPVEVCDRQDHGIVCQKPVDDCIRKALQSDLPDAFGILDGPSLRIIPDKGECVFDVIQKLGAEPRPTAIVEIARRK
jgi:hypothetical protein